MVGFVRSFPLPASIPPGGDTAQQQTRRAVTVSKGREGKKKPPADGQMGLRGVLWVRRASAQ